VSEKQRSERARSPAEGGSQRRKRRRAEPRLLLIVEMLAAAIVGISIAVVPMAWEWEVLFVLAVVALSGRMAFTSPWTFLRPRSDKLLLLGVAAILVGVLAYPSLRQRLHEARHPPDPAKSAAQEATPADLLVVGVEAQAPTKDVGLTFNVHIENAGETPALGPRYLSGVVATQHPLDANGESRVFADLEHGHSTTAADAPALNRYETTTLSVGSPAGPQAITDRAFQEYIRDKANIYLYLIMTYRNKTDNQLFATEYCQYLDFDLPAGARWQTSAARLCQGHNTTYEVSTAK